MSPSCVELARTLSFVTLGFMQTSQGALLFTSLGGLMGALLYMRNGALPLGKIIANIIIALCILCIAATVFAVVDEGSIPQMGGSTAACKNSISEFVSGMRARLTN